MDILQIDQQLKSLMFPNLRIKVYTYLILLLTLFNFSYFSSFLSNNYAGSDSLAIIRLEFDASGDSIDVICFFIFCFLVLYHNLSLKVKLITNEINNELLNIYSTQQIPFDYRMKINLILLDVNKFYLGNEFGPLFYLCFNLLILLASTVLDYP